MRRAPCGVRTGGHPIPPISSAAARHGEGEVEVWVRGYPTLPPPLEETDERFPGNQREYRRVPAGELPRAESLRDAAGRALAYWRRVVAPHAQQGQRVSLPTTPYRLPCQVLPLLS